ncbi:hypothetical protein GJAV_G00040370 [Gymnothorax javanicus]|nr:hypothetical protein GJAV_G00040370 [Gymnothorax javanicus]
MERASSKHLDIVIDGPGPEEEVVQPGQPDPDPEAEDTYQSDVEGDDVLHAVLPHITLTSKETAVVHPLAFGRCLQSKPSSSLSEGGNVLLSAGGEWPDRGQAVPYNRAGNTVLEVWNAVEEHDKQPQQFHQLNRTHWGNTLYCRTKRDDPVDAAVIQRVKMAKCYAPAQQNISAQNRPTDTLVKLLWLRSPHGSRSSPEKSTILKAYERIQHRILVEDPVLCKAGIPLPKINIKTVRDFMRRQETLLILHATKQLSTTTKTTSISPADLPPAPHQPAVLPPPHYPN